MNTPKFVASIDTKVLDMTIDAEKARLDRDSVISFIRNSYHKIYSMEEQEEFLVGIHNIEGKIVPIIARKDGSYFVLRRVPDDYEYSLKELKLLKRIKELNDGEKQRIKDETLKALKRKYLGHE